MTTLERHTMKTPALPRTHIEVTETLVRLYVFLAQHLDRCANETARATYPEQELQAHLTSTRAEMRELLSINQVVQEKVEQECNRVFALTAACLTNGDKQGAALEDVKAERAVLKTKTMALSDVLAVFRAA
jgi:hypothetical protein